MDFEQYLIEQLNKHPAMQPQDLVKMCYQAAYGAEHLLADPHSAWIYLKKEYEQLEIVDTCPEKILYEEISSQVCRIHLSAWKSKGLPLEWLHTMFVASCKGEENAQAQFTQYLETAGKIVREKNLGFTIHHWEEYCSDYKKRGMPPVHHSQEYREKEHPNYRIVHSHFCRILPILELAKKYLQANTPCVIAIDGRAASGKTTLASLLKLVLHADIIHLDDFFLPPELRQKERFQTPGGNIHHERFIQQVLPFLSQRTPFSYQIFDCSTMKYSGVQQIGTQFFRVVEGSYSCHPFFGDYADITIFADVSSDEQEKRIRQRNGEELLKMFVSRWIPLEEAYFSHFQIKEKAQLIL